ncbi:MAG TPA: beta-propeller fold lactonase family protein [Dehalococcoidia bacterium]|nr:beta-propeller fold lactonase family protein [Dehalococcoidia bacterium]
MPTQLYLSLQDEDRIGRFALDEANGRLSAIGAIQVADGPGPLALHPTGSALYVGHRGPGARRGGRVDGLPRPEFALSSFAIDRRTGELMPGGRRVPVGGEPCFLATDRRGRYLLSAYYQAGHCAVHPIDAKGALGGAAIEWRDTNSGAHSFQMEASNRFAFVPHIAQSPPLARLPAGRQTAANAIFQFRFDPETGQLTPNDPPRVSPEGPLGPRHFVFHPTLPLLYVDNEQGSSVTVYALDRERGTLQPGQTISTLPDGFAGTNHPSEIALHPSGRWLYVANRGHNSIAIFHADDAGALISAGWEEAPAGPRTLALDPGGRFLYSSGLERGELRSYRIDPASGALDAIESLSVGALPMWITIVALDG